jgi:ABC-type sugar transport system ATPase subunit
MTAFPIGAQEPLLILDNITKRFGTVTANQNIHLEICRGRLIYQLSIRPDGMKI